MKTLLHWLKKAAQGWLALLGLVIFAAFMIFVLPMQAQQAEESSGGAGSPDTALFYSPQTLYDFAESYGPEGRRAYIQARLTFDMIWPLVYCLFLTTSLGWVFQRGFPEESPWQIARLAPIMGLSMDYFENIATVIVMARYPQRTPLAAGLAVIFTPLKWLFVGGSFLLLMIGALTAAWRWVKIKRHK